MCQSKCKSETESLGLKKGLPLLMLTPAPSSPTSPSALEEKKRHGRLANEQHLAEQSWGLPGRLHGRSCFGLGCVLLGTGFATALGHAGESRTLPAGLRVRLGLPGPKESLTPQSDGCSGQRSAGSCAARTRGPGALSLRRGPAPQPGSRRPILTVGSGWGAHACPAAGGSVSSSVSNSISPSPSTFIPTPMLLAVTSAASSMSWHILSRKPSREVCWSCPGQLSRHVGWGFPAPSHYPQRDMGQWGPWARPQQELAGGQVAPSPPAPTSPHGPWPAAAGSCASCASAAWAAAASSRPSRAERAGVSGAAPCPWVLSTDSSPAPALAPSNSLLCAGGFSAS